MEKRILLRKTLPERKLGHAARRKGNTGYRDVPLTNEFPFKFFVSYEPKLSLLPSIAAVAACCMRAYVSLTVMRHSSYGMEFLELHRATEFRLGWLSLPTVQPFNYIALMVVVLNCMEPFRVKPQPPLPFSPCMSGSRLRFQPCTSATLRL
jgi:hypothetical protein